MMKGNKNQKEILEKLGIAQLTPMQEEAKLAIHSKGEVMVLSPTGSGKTLAFLLPILSEIDAESECVQALILAPSRELSMQIEQVAKDMGTGIKINAVYGGRPISKDKMDLKHEPALLIGTPGRVADHFRRGTVSVDQIKMLVLDEFDKSLEVGFEEEMEEIMSFLPTLKKKILTSATKAVEIPRFVEVNDPLVIDYLGEGVQDLTVKSIISPDKDKIDTLLQAIKHLGNHPGIVFCNYKDSIQRVSDFLTENKIPHGCYYGGLEQHDRERALIKFRNGTHQLLIATDLAARGLDIPDLRYIIHYHLPHRKEEFIHRNGRTARMEKDGAAFVLHWTDEELPDFIGHLPQEALSEEHHIEPSEWETLFVSGGRKDKISKGDIVGLFFKQGKLGKNDLGLIELKSDCAFVAVKKKKVNQLLQLIDNTRLKKKKVRIYPV